MSGPEPKNFDFSYRADRASEMSIDRFGVGIVYC
ncbi:uncharacterized protein MEPE_03351 [Melanopsichium pennsylvanicum]|uniref:Uncharacterized protein n=1 Tax=Melanopsichium pennsylvanicum TaxID=63383 RepID=A0AAJ4XMM9_9BASI|nr:uncharacterized protein MEPE_03351 [Melanopsichium pennsylvanicum]